MKNENYLLLRNAIIYQAILDVQQGTRREQEDALEFLRSEYCESLLGPNLTSQDLLDRLHSIEVPLDEL